MPLLTSNGCIVYFQSYVDFRQIWKLVIKEHKYYVINVSFKLKGILILKG